MKKFLGLSLPELMVSIAVVSVVGAGMYVGFQQIDSARQVAEQTLSNENQQGLLLDLIESETNLAGQGVSDGKSVCLIAPSGSGFASDCSGDAINPVGQSHGVAVCRQIGEDYQTTLFYASGPGTALGNNRTDDLRCGTATDQFYQSYSKVFTGASCDLPSDAIDQLGEANLRSENLCQLEFRRNLGGVAVAIQTAGRLTGETDGNNFVFNARGETQDTVVAETSETLVQLDDPYLIGFEQGQFFVASGSTATAYLKLNRVALEALTVNYIVRDESGNVVRTGTVTFAVGDATASVGSLAPGETIEIVSDNTVLADGNIVFDVQELASDNTDPPVISYVLYDKSLSYEQGFVSFRVIADRAMPNAMTVYMTAENLNDTSIVLDSNTNASAPAAIKYPGNTTIAPNTNTDVRAGSYVFTFPANQSYVDMKFKPHTTEAAKSLGDQTFRLGFIEPSDLTGYPASQFNYEIRESAGDLLSVLEAGQIPEVYFLRANAVAKEPVAGENRSIAVTLIADPAPEAALDVDLTVGESGITCGSSASDDFSMDVITAASANCTTVQFSAGQERATVELQLNPHTGLRTDSNNEIVLTLPNPEDTEGYDGYTVDTARDTLTAFIEEEQVPELSLVSSSAASSFNGESRLHSAATTTVSGMLSAATTPAIRIEDGRDEILLFEEAGTDAAWASGSLPISLNDVQVSGTVYVTVASAAGLTSDEGHLTYGVDFALGDDSNNDGVPDDSGVTAGTHAINFDRTVSDTATLNFWVYNDYTEESHEKIRLKIDRATGEGRTRPPSNTADGYSLDITVVDNDQCAVGGDMTIGDSRVDHFHTVGLDDMTNENVTAATVRISSGYDSSTDRLLIDGITPTTAVNVTTYSGGSVTYNSTTYSGITAKFFTNQGVLEITRSTALPAPAMVKFFNESVYFQSTASGNSARSATFTLGDAQAWDSHEDGTTHYYRFVPGTLIQFDASNTAAASDAKRYFGVKGYLATVTSRAENTFLGEKFNVNGGPPAGWLGGWDNTEGTWEWMNGPEKGRRFLSANTTCGGTNKYHVIRGAGNGAGTASAITRQAYDQTIAMNGSTHESNSWSLGHDHQNMRYNEYSESIDSTTGRVTHPSNPYRYSNFGNCEPNDAGPYEDKLQMTGNSVGGRLWNDLPGDLNTITGAYAASDSPYSVSGYYQEFGGPLKSEWGFYNRKFSQTNNFTTGACSVTKSTAGIGLTQDSCEAWSDLTIGTGTSATSGFDFFGPTSSVNGQNISSARVSISSGYVSGTDELVINGVTANTGTTGQKKYLNFSVEYDGSTYNNIDAIFFINQGVMEITRYTTASGSTKATMPANAMVKLFNEKVEFVHDPSGSGLVSSTEREVTYTLGEAQAWFSHEDGGTRYYRYVPEHLTWTNARNAAKSDAQKYFGVRGYLATVTSKAENDFLADRFNDNGGPPAGWLNGNDASSEKDWRWKGGPEDGRRFWQNNGTGGKYITGTGNGAGTARTVTKSCVQQSQAWNGHAHASGYLHRLNYGYTETLTNGVPSGSTSSHSNVRFANWSCYNSSNGMEPNNSGNEDYLQLNGGAKGGGMWNDLRVNQGTGTGVYHIKGYYIEYGGPSTYSDSFSDRQLGATFRINPQECALVRVE